MNVTAAGASSPDLTPSAVNTLANVAALASLSPHSRQANDTVAASLSGLTSAPILNLLQIVEDRVFPQGSQHLESIPTSSHFAMDGLYSRPAQTPGPNPAHGTFETRDSAEKIVAKAANTIETAGFHTQRIPVNLDPRAVIALASQFIATGQLPNYLRAAEMGRVVISWYDEASPASVRFIDGPVAPYRQPPLRMRLQSLLGKMWLRVPLLVLLIGWLLSGGIAGLLTNALDVPDYRTESAFKIWAIGFLVLVVFQFVATVRGALRSMFRRTITKPRA